MGSRFEKFSERARRVLSLAQEEAQRFNHNYIGTEHILLGLVRETEGVAAPGAVQPLRRPLEGAFRCRIHHRPRRKAGPGRDWPHPPGQRRWWSWRWTKPAA